MAQGPFRMMRYRVYQRVAGRGPRREAPDRRQSLVAARRGRRPPRRARRAADRLRRGALSRRSPAAALGPTAREARPRQCALPQEQSRRPPLDRAGFLLENTLVLWRSVGDVMKSEECRERASHCFHLANSARNDQSRSTFNSLAQHWLRLAEELEHDHHPVERPRATGRAQSAMLG